MDKDQTAETLEMVWEKTRELWPVRRPCFEWSIPRAMRVLALVGWADRRPFAREADRTATKAEKKAPVDVGTHPFQGGVGNRLR